VSQHTYRRYCNQDWIQYQASEQRIMMWKKSQEGSLIIRSPGPSDSEVVSTRRYQCVCVWPRRPSTLSHCFCHLYPRKSSSKLQLLGHRHSCFLHESLHLLLHLSKSVHACWNNSEASLKLLQPTTPFQPPTLDHRIIHSIPATNLANSRTHTAHITNLLSNSINNSRSSNHHSKCFHRLQHTRNRIRAQQDQARAVTWLNLPIYHHPCMHTVAVRDQILWSRWADIYKPDYEQTVGPQDRSFRVRPYSKDIPPRERTVKMTLKQRKDQEAPEKEGDSISMRCCNDKWIGRSIAGGKYLYCICCHRFRDCSLVLGGMSRDEIYVKSFAFLYEERVSIVDASSLILFRTAQNANLNASNRSCFLLISLHTISFTCSI
jgi:hypothetical protein